MIGTSSKVSIIFFMTVFVNSKVFSKVRGYQALTTYILILAKYSHRRLTFGKSKTQALKAISNNIGVSVNTLRNHLKVLEGFNLCYEHNNQIIFRSNKELQELFPRKGGAKYVFFVFTNKQQLKKQIRAIPLWSSVSKQNKAIARRAKYDTIKTSIEKGRPISKKDYNFFKRQNTDKLFIPNAILTTKKVLELSNRRSNATATRRKKEATITGRYKRKRAYKYYGFNRTYTEFNELRRAGIIPNYAKFNNGTIFWDMPTIFTENKGYIQVKAGHILIKNTTKIGNFSNFFSNSKKKEKKKIYKDV